LSRLKTKLKKKITTSLKNAKFTKNSKLTNMFVRFYDIQMSQILTNFLVTSDGWVIPVNLTFANSQEPFHCRVCGILLLDRQAKLPKDSSATLILSCFSHFSDYIEHEVENLKVVD
jgi:hypothetical protein